VLCRLVKIVQIRKEKVSVSIAKNFSKVVLAITFPIVFNPKTIRKNHKEIFTILVDMTSLIYFPLIRRIAYKKRLIITEIVSKAYISLSFSNLPPHVISYGTIFNIMLK
jgi:hypothetical protein